MPSSIPIRVNKINRIIADNNPTTKKRYKQLLGLCIKELIHHFIKLNCANKDNPAMYMYDAMYHKYSGEHFDENGSILGEKRCDLEVILDGDCLWLMCHTYIAPIQSLRFYGITFTVIIYVTLFRKLSVHVKKGDILCVEDVSAS
jgi:hypothetical protein